jgi:hypothetical protein
VVSWRDLSSGGCCPHWACSIPNNVEVSDGFREDDQETFKLADYNPEVNATQDATTEDIRAESTLGNGYHLVAKIPKGTKFLGDSATVTAVARVGHNGIPIRIVMRTAYAPRFAKALSHAITVCGGGEPF